MVGDMVGDHECAVNAGATSIVVLGGFLNTQWAENLNPPPDFIFNDISDAVKNYDTILEFVNSKNHH